MLYAVIKRFDSLREITTSLQAETHKLNHLGIKTMPTKSTLADANKRRSEAIFEAITEVCTPNTRATFPRTAEATVAGILLG